MDFVWKLKKVRFTNENPVRSTRKVQAPILKVLLPDTGAFSCSKGPGARGDRQGWGHGGTDRDGDKGGRMGMGTRDRDGNKGDR